jgi:hypothetical protein
MNSRNCLLLLFAFITVLTARPTTWTTIHNGNWTIDSIWNTGIAPSYSGSDTIIIKDTVYFDHDVHLYNGGLLQIDSNRGALCGHQLMTIHTGAKLNKYGALDLDTLYLDGGNGYFTGEMLAFRIEMKNGAYAFFTSFSMLGWDTCFIPFPYPEPQIDSVINYEYEIYPNPSDGNFKLEYSQPNQSMFYLFDEIGQIISSSTIAGTSGLKNFMFNNLNCGVYYWKIVSDDITLQTKKIIIVK